MDIDLLWAFGGWFQLVECMATTTTTTSTSKPYLNRISFLGFLLILFLLSTQLEPTKLGDPSMASSSLISSRRLLSEDSDNSMVFHPKPTRTKPQASSSSSSGSRAHREFEAGAHGVPSGPNPISNR